ncbi:BRCT-containing protein 1 [Smittium mucronatum]|uniref:BRCT-containing protein 1 n=1 Tax=Smittium mucronatum TaxID=133383 RepID=A0A1R0H6C3_9FUNG|nr:BRCT-containing protein 1 [Smittium mucronatum]
MDQALVPSNQILVFKNVVFWVNPSIDSSQVSRLSNLLIRKGAISAIKLHCSSNSPNNKVGSPLKLRGVSVGLPDSLSPNFFRFPFPTNQSLPPNFSSNPQKEVPTHVISKDIYFPEYLKCIQTGIKVVTPAWVEKSIKTGKIQPENFFSCDLDRNIFSGMVVTASQLPTSDREALYAGISAYGGQYRANLVKEVTHLVILTGSGSKYDQVLANPKLNIKIILPHWFEQCINLGILVDDRPYLFPDPKIFNVSSYTLHKPEHNITNISQSNEVESLNINQLDRLNIEQYLDDVGVKINHSSSSSNNSFLSGYNVALSLELTRDIPDSFLDFIKSSVYSNGGNFISPQLNDCNQYFWSPDQFGKIDILICRYRKGLDYFAATMFGFLVGSLIWFIKALRSKFIYQPGKQILDYPLSLNSIFNKPNSITFPDENYNVISLSGYSGHARAYLKRLILASGAVYSSDLTKNVHTHLITADPNREKFNFAREWNCHVVNHLWLERSLQQGKNLSVSYPSYTFWPPLSPLSLQDTVGFSSSIKHSCLLNDIPVIKDSYSKIIVNSTDLYSDNASAPLSSFDVLNGKNIQISVFISENEEIFLNSNLLHLDTAAKFFVFLSKVCGHFLNLDNFVFDGTPIIDSKAPENNIPTNSNIKNDYSNDLECIPDSTDDESSSQKPKYLLGGYKSTNLDSKNTQEILVQVESASIYEDGMNNSEISSNSSKNVKNKSRSSENEISDSDSDHKPNKIKKRKAPPSSTDSDHYRTVEAALPLKNKAFPINPNPINVKNLNSLLANKSSKKRGVSQNSSPTKSIIEIIDIKKPFSAVNILFTQGKPTSGEEKKIINMGGNLVNVVKNATHLVSNGVKRTAKFLEALNSGKIYIVSMQWLRHSILLKSWIDLSSDLPSKEVISLCKKIGTVNQDMDLNTLSKNNWVWMLGYGINDPELEQKYNFVLKDSIEKSHRAQLFNNIIVYSTPNVKPSMDVLRGIVESGGGLLVANYTERKLKSLILKETIPISSTPEVSLDKRKLLVISCELDQSIWPTLFEISNSQYSKDETNSEYEDSSNKKLNIYSSEILLSGVLRQNLATDTDEFRLA